MYVCLVQYLLSSWRLIQLSRPRDLQADRSISLIEVSASGRQLVSLLEEPKLPHPLPLEESQSIKQSVGRSNSRSVALSIRRDDLTASNRRS